MVNRSSPVHIQADDQLSIERMPRQYDSAGGSSSSQLFGAGAFTQDGQRQRSQVRPQLLVLWNACVLLSAATRPAITVNACGLRTSWGAH